jgi:hypothetical protein
MADQSKWHDILRKKWQASKSLMKHTDLWTYWKDYVYDDVTGRIIHQDRIKAREQALQASVETQPPTSKEPAKGALGELCGRQQAAVIGQAVPIVFARRVGDRGGVFITPPATDARYENDASNSLTAKYHLILGDGPMGSVQVRDVFQCTCRIGSFTQTYNQRAGNWDPGNFLVERVGYTLQNVPDYCGSKGSCEGLSTMSYENTYPDGSGDWALEVQIFIREGRTVTRLADSVSGPSSNFADLFKLAMEVGAKLPADMIDTARLQTAALFLDANELYCDVNLEEVQSIDDFIASNAPYFLVRETRVNGKRGLRPLLPIDDAYAIKTDPIPWEFEFTEEFIIPGSLQVEYTPLEQRKPKLMLGMWRQQPDDTFGVTRTAEVGYAVDRSSSNVEQHDLSMFCTHELHAVRAMAYRRARQKWSTHTIVWTCRPEVYNRILEEGDIVRVTFQRNASDGSTTTHDYLYELDKIEKTSTGEIAFQATHFPIDAEGRSLVALTVAQAETQGVGYEDNIRTGIDCDENSSTDTSVPTGVGQIISTGDPAEQPPLPPSPPAPESDPSDPPPPEPPPGGCAPPPVPPTPIPTPPDDPEDPCEPECTHQTICDDPGSATTWGVRFSYINSCTSVVTCRIVAYNVDSKGVPTIISTTSGNQECTTGSFSVSATVQFSDGSTEVVFAASGFGSHEYLDNYRMVYDVPAGSYPCDFAPASCPAGTTQVGIITAHQPDGDQTCVICETCVAPEGCEPPTTGFHDFIYTITDSNGQTGTGSYRVFLDGNQIWAVGTSFNWPSPTPSYTGTSGSPAGPGGFWSTTATLTRDNVPQEDCFGGHDFLFFRFNADGSFNSWVYLSTSTVTGSINCSSPIGTVKTLTGYFQKV